MLSKLPDLLIAIVLILVLSASMSTLSSLVLTSSSTLTLNLIEPLRKKEMQEKGKMTVMRIFVAVFIAISAAIAIVQARSKVTFIAQLMGVSWGALAGAFLAPFVYGLFWKKTTKQSVAASFIFGCGMMVVQLLKSLGLITIQGGVLGFVFQNSIYSGVIAMVAGLIIVPVVSLLTRKGIPAGVDDAFACYEKKVNVSQKTSLTD